ncbi:MAG: hypothetical protein KF770_01180 [Anaerolineae bacterium]|nr:hypothetical protein [Anaerolineae bacterium]
MSPTVDIVHEDLDVLAAMAAEMDDYLKSDVLYWPMVHGDMPRLTLGGYLMRQHRLQYLADMLNEAEREKWDTAVHQFQAALAEKVVRTEQRAHEELGVRARQWGTYLNDVQRERAVAAVNYETAVENRVMAAALVHFLQTAPYELEAGAVPNLEMLDAGLRPYWQPGEFVWPPAWEKAYPQAEYWWLYGRPRRT